MTNQLLLNLYSSKITRWTLMGNEPTLQRRLCHRLTHYQVLGLKQDCTRKEIRSAFIALSKEHHPDMKPNDKGRHAKFVLINEAYSVLMRRQSRMIYDEALQNRMQGFHEYIHVRRSRENPDNVYGPESKRPNRPEDIFWKSPDRSQDKYYSSSPYYGIKGLQRLPNWYIAIGCCVCVLLSSVAFVIATKSVAELRREETARNNKTTMAVYSTVKKQARENSYAEQMQLLQLNIENRKRMKEKALND